MSRRKRVRGGIIPYYYDEGDNETFFLLGKQIYGKWSPLGGTIERGEQIIDGAIREFIEEIMGLYRKEDIEPYIMEDDKIVTQDYDTIDYHYLVPFDWEPNLPMFFQNISDFFKRCAGNRRNAWGLPVLGKCQEGLFEVGEIGWFTLSSLKGMTDAEKDDFFGKKASRRRVIEMLFTIKWEDRV